MPNVMINESADQINLAYSNLGSGLARNKGATTPCELDPEREKSQGYSCVLKRHLIDDTISLPDEEERRPE